MNLIFDNTDTLKRRIILVIGILVGLSTLVLATPVSEEDRLTKEEAKTLIEKIKEDFDLEEDEQFYEFDELEIAFPIKIVKIYDGENELLLEAPIHRLEQMSNKTLRKLINASDLLITQHNIEYYRLDI